jgi:outer membrane protein assembly factor BamB
MNWRKPIVGIFIGLMCSQIGLAQTRQVNDGFEVADTDWPWWRGPHRNGEASPKQSPPSTWSDDGNILWKAPIGGRGYGSPIVFENMVILQTANEESGSQTVVALRRDTGSVLWETVVHKTGGMRKNPKSTAASNTAAWDGERLYVNFANSDAVYLTCLDQSGQQLWQREICKYVEHQGYGSSPLLYQSLVIVNGDNKGGGAIVALDRKSGEEVWRRQRPTKPNYPSPVVLRVSGRDQLIMTGCDLVTSLNPLTGDTLWEVEGATTECVTSTVTDGERVFTSGGYPKNHISAVRADGSNKIDWESNDRVYVPSLLYRDGYLFGILDAGVAACWKSDTGKEVWRSRLGGTFSSSPVLVGDTIYATNEAGETFLFKANTEAFEWIGSNKLGDEVLATPVIVDSRIYYRASVMENDKRQEFLYCIGSPIK